MYTFSLGDYTNADSLYTVPDKVATVVIALLTDRGTFALELSQWEVIVVYSGLLWTDYLCLCCHELCVCVYG